MEVGLRSVHNFGTYKMNAAAQCRLSTNFVAKHVFLIDSWPTWATVRFLYSSFSSLEASLLRRQARPRQKIELNYTQELWSENALQKGAEFVESGESMLHTSALQQSRGRWLVNLDSEIWQSLIYR